jgi:hypothetical protein
MQLAAQPRAGMDGNRRGWSRAPSSPTLHRSTCGLPEPGPPKKGADMIVVNAEVETDATSILRFYEAREIPFPG